MKTTAELAVTTGKQFFQALVEHLTALLSPDCASLKRLMPGSPSRAVTLAVAPKPEVSDDSEYPLAGSPDGGLLQAGPFAHSETGNAEHWSGILLAGSSGKPVGVLSVIFRRPPDNLGEVEAALARYAPRAAAEIEKEQTEEALRRTESRYRELIQHSGEGVWCLESVPPIPLDLSEDDFLARFWESRLAVANDAAALMLGYQCASQIVDHRFSEFRNILQNIEPHIRQQIRNGFPARTLEFSIVRDGVESWWERSVVPIVEAGRLLRVWGTSRDISERRRHQQQIEALNLSLQRVVADRTAQLAAANQELESFSYSVSHDLRAAIQGILACSRIVVQDHGDRLDETGKLWLTHMAEDAAQLDKLTMALLDLSLVSRAQFSRSSVDLSRLAESTFQRLLESDPARVATFRTLPELVVSGDESLLRAVMDNLLGNAWKFTRNRPVADIEFGRTEHSGEPVFFVRDNGVGFNMKYADKLFGAFQRLHRAEDFEGNGIGLATVRRVVHRHGGRVWAEAKSGGGATFFFTLGKSDIP